MATDISIIMYHYVRDSKKSKFPQIRGLEMSDFIEQLNYLRKNFHVATMEEIIEYIENREPIPKDSVLLTFDDAYSDHYENVFPLLTKLKIQGSFFVPVESLQEKKLLDVNKIHIILASVSDPSLIVKDIQRYIENNKGDGGKLSFEDYYKELIPSVNKDDPNVPWALLHDSEDIIFIKRILQYGLPTKLRSELINKLLLKYVDHSEESLYQDFYCTESQLLEMQNSGMHIGNHGYQHYWWDKLNKEDLEEETKKSIKYLKHIGLKMNSWTFCYPYGSYSDDAKDVLQSHGCKAAFTTINEKATLDKKSRFSLSRIDTNNLLNKVRNAS